MKKINYFLYVAAVALLWLPTSCEKDDEAPVQTYAVTVQLAYPDGFEPAEGVPVTLRNTITGGVNEALTNAGGAASFTVIAGAYEASATEKRIIGGRSYLFNGLQTGVTVTEAWTSTDAINITLTPSETKQIVIKELYNGGTRREDNTTFQFDKYIILYNNSDEVASLQNLCLAMVTPPTATNSNKDYIDGVLFYEAEGWVPAGTGIWTFQNDVRLEPGKQAVIALNAAINHLPVVPSSINFENPDYFVTYAPELYNHASYHPAPSEVIPTSHYLKGYKLPGVTSSGWSPAVNSPAVFVFSPEGVTPDAFANDASTIDLYMGSTSQARQKVPVDWVIDGIEVFVTGTASLKRLTAAVDAGYVSFTNYQGHTFYRNVDKEATEAVPGNTGKLVYSYSLGTEGSTDPNNIDAEASIKAGARIIYKDTNNSTNDFHVRSRASLRD